MRTISRSGGVTTQFWVVVGLLIVAAILGIAYAHATIWALNTLFALSITYDALNIVAMMVLLGIFQVGVSRKSK
jgi:hypothetical protein